MNAYDMKGSVEIVDVRTLVEVIVARKFVLKVLKVVEMNAEVSIALSL